MMRLLPLKPSAALGALLTLMAGTYAMADTTTAEPSVAEPNPTIGEVSVGTTIKAARLPDNVYLRDVNDPDDIIWDRIPAYRVGLTAAPPVHASTQLRYDPALSGHVYFQVARTSERFYVRMRWPDATLNRDTKVDAFADGAAVQFALNGPDTSFMMGTAPDYPVNIWYWRADRDTVENLAAAGFGSTTLLPEQVVTGKGTYHSDDQNRNQEWHVVMSRPLDVTGEYQIGLQSGTVPISFALWQGDKGHRDGNKILNMGWVLVDIEAEP